MNAASPPTHEFESQSTGTRGFRRHSRAGGTVIQSTRTPWPRKRTRNSADIFSSTHQASAVTSAEQQQQQEGDEEEVEGKGPQEPHSLFSPVSSSLPAQSRHRGSLATLATSVVAPCVHGPRAAELCACRRRGGELARLRDQPVRPPPCWPVPDF